ncbi:MAG TPA: hypothetical protein VGS22_29795 [Thermoanaerobaculia bacterium]|jgi:hypothetical protein|nr:hypothetical protein [Thermoanaerobaculia bacterium]
MSAPHRLAKGFGLRQLWGVALFAALPFLSACEEKAPEAEPAAKETAPAAAPAPAAQTASTSNQQCAPPPPCGSNCSNTSNAEAPPCWTTPYGPAEADVIIPGEPKGGAVTSTNMLYCSSATYALCFFSGPPNPTGRHPNKNQVLSCTVDGDTAHCTCQAYTGHSFVDINGILNFGAYNQTVYGSTNPTVQACGADGSGCANITTCGSDGKKSTCGDLPEAPVCQYIKNQSAANPQASLYPNADLISTFSFAMQPEYPLGSYDCTTPPGPYAGCMTAPCKYQAGTTGAPKNGTPVTCDCPIMNGPFQIGQKDQTSCTIPSDANGSYVWSASYTVPGS